MLSTLLYGAESWTLYRNQVRKLHAFMMRHLRAIMGISWKDKVTNVEILQRANYPLWRTYSCCTDCCTTTTTDWTTAPPPICLFFGTCCTPRLFQPPRLFYQPTTRVHTWIVSLLLSFDIMKMAVNVYPCKRVPACHTQKGIILLHHVTFPHFEN